MKKLSNIAKQLGSAGGKKSVKARFGGKTKEEVSQTMRKVRMTALAKAVNPPKGYMDQIMKETIDNLNKNVLKESEES